MTDNGVTVNEGARTTAAVPMASAIVCATALLAALTALACIAHRASAGTGVDHQVLAWFVAHRHGWLTAPAIAITDVGSPMATVVGAVLLAGLFWLRRRSVIPALAIVATLGIAGAASTLLKIVVGVHRPPLSTQLLTETDASFPSGHVTGTVALTIIVATVLGQHRGQSTRVWLYAAAFGITVVVAVTRLYLGVHWLTDVVGGLLLGTAVAAIGSAAYRTFAGPEQGRSETCSRCDAGGRGRRP